ncbi:MAG: hypothetical protein ABSB63_12710 [Spirochaetia bacterium]
MKTRTMLFAALVILLALTLLGGCGAGKYVPKPNEEVYGTWINKSISPQKEVDTPDGWKQYGLISDPNPESEGTGQITSKWTDSEGNVWYKTLGTVTAGNYKGSKFQTLTKLSKSGTVKESVSLTVEEFDSSGYPTKIDPKEMLYSLYYRTEK